MPPFPPQRLKPNIHLFIILFLFQIREWKFIKKIFEYAFRNLILYMSSNGLTFDKN